ncbi:hypothetical protein AGMMS50256_14650 [Betaproteobacteria bacterium]|nr:hypothetical protein AGMMS50256_14650 [Betaproteobacteria bacterium]
MAARNSRPIDCGSLHETCHANKQIPKGKPGVLLFERAEAAAQSLSPA